MEILLCGFPRFFFVESNDDFSILDAGSFPILSAFHFSFSYNKKTSNFLPLSHKRIMELYWFSSSSHFHFSQFEKLTIWMKQNWNSSALLFPQKKIDEINNLKGLFLEEKNSGYFCWRQTKFILSQISKLFIYVITRFVKINGMRAWGKNEEMRLNRTA